MGSRIRGIAVLSSLWAGCGSTAVSVPLPPELFSGNARSAILLLETSSHDFPGAEAFAVSEKREPRFRFELERPENTEAFLFAFALSLETLELAEGPLPKAKGAEAGRPLPAEELWSSWRSGALDSSRGWTTDGSLHPEDLPFRLPPLEAPDPCEGFGGTSWELADFQNTNVLAVVALSEHRALVGGGGARNLLGIFEETDAVDLLPLLPEDTRVLSLAKRTDDLFLGTTSRGQLFELSLSQRAFVRTATVPSPSWVVGARDGSAFLLRSETLLYRLDEQLLLTELPGAPAKPVSVAWVGANRIVATAENGIHYFDGDSWREEFCCDAVQTVTGNEQVQFAAGFGGVWKRDASTREWARLPHPANLEFRYSGVVSGDRLVLGGGSGYTGLWTGSEWCRGQTGLGRAVRALDVTDDGSVAFTGSLGEGGALASITRLPIPPP